MKKGVCLIFLAGAALGQLFAQDQEASPSPTPLKRGIWRADMPGGTYIVKLSTISSLSMHEYLVDGATRVTEVNIGTLGSVLARFYYIEPNIPKAPGGIGQGTLDAIKERAQEASTRAGADDVWLKVVKNYPTTTHAHTVEYRLGTKESLQKLFDSVENAWLNGNATTFKP